MITITQRVFMALNFPLIDSNRKVAESSRKYHGFIGSVVIYALGQGFWLLMG